MSSTAPRPIPAGLPLVRATLGFAPAVPPPCTHSHPVHQVVELESMTKTLHVSPLHRYRAWTFNGTVRAARTVSLQAGGPFCMHE